MEEEQIITTVGDEQTVVSKRRGEGVLPGPGKGFKPAKNGQYILILTNGVLVAHKRVVLLVKGFFLSLCFHYTNKKWASSTEPLAL